MRYGNIVAAAILSAGILGGTTLAVGQPSQSDLMRRIERLENEVGVQRDIEEVRRLQYAYNYYNSSGLTVQLLDLVSPNAEAIEIGGQGVFKGKAGFARLFSQYNNGKVEDRTGAFGGVLFQVAGQDAITISPDRKKAYARVRVLTPVFRGWPKAKPRFNGGDYEMEYTKENGKWMIHKFKYVHAFVATFEPDGTVSAGYSTGPSKTADAPTTWYHPWPETGVLAFHYPNPVTGKFSPDTTGKTQYWTGNWPGEFGKTGLGSASSCRAWS